MIIKGLGIVSKIELAFFVMFIALIVWSFTTYLHVGFAKITHQSAAKKGEEVYVNHSISQIELIMTQVNLARVKLT